MRKIIRLVFLLAISAVALTGCSTFSEKDNSLPPAPLVQFTPTIKVAEMWTAKIGKGSGNYYLRLTPKAVGNKVFAADYEGNFAAFAADSGKIIWQQYFDDYLTSGISAGNGKLFVATGEGEVIALSQEDGQQLWKTKVGSEILATPTAVKDIVLVKSIDGSVTALSQIDGRQLWHFEQNVPALILHASSQPQVAGSSAVVGFANGHLASLNLKTGVVLWNRTIAEGAGATVVERMVDIDVSPVVVNGVVYVATYQGRIAALDLHTGKTIWRHTISAYSGLTADAKQIYISDAASYVWAFNNDVGAVVWRQKAMEGRKLTGPALLQNYLVVADSEGYLHWLSKSDGSFVARSHLDSSGAIAAPIVADNTVYVYTRAGYLYAFHISK